MSFGKIEAYPNQHPDIGPQERIAYRGELKPLLTSVTTQYDFGDYIDHEIKQNGYEDFNLVLKTSKGHFFIKCFADWRNQADCERYLGMIEGAKAQGGVITPELYRDNRGEILSTIHIDNTRVNLCCMQYIDGGNIWESKKPLSKSEQVEVITQAAKINSCDLRPTHVEDSWAIVNISKNYAKNHDKIDDADKTIIEKLVSRFELVDINALPHAFVHGDIRSTNVMRNSDGKIYIIDFSVANWYPRIVEMAVLFCDIMFDPNNPTELDEKYKWALNKYQEAGVVLTPLEQDQLPLFIKLAHSTNVIGASSANATNYISKDENNYWLETGRKGLGTN